MIVLVDIRRVIVVSLAAVTLTGCAPADPGEGQASAADVAGQDFSARAQAVLDREMTRIDAVAAGADSIFQPLPLLTPAQEEALRRFGNDEQLARARALGVGRNLPADSMDRLLAGGRLVRLEDTEYWIVRDLDDSQPLVIPAVPVLLREIGLRFQRRLAELGAPPFRLEISSVTRTAADQERLRQINPNAATGESTHEYGTTVDVLYSAYAAPAAPLTRIDTAGAEWMEPFLTRYATIAAERVAARRALELKAVLGQVLLELQGEGAVMVTLERQQPVFHFTVAR